MMFLFIIGCAETQEEPTNALCVHDPPLTYANFGKAYMDIHCIGCHSVDIPEGHRVGAPIGVDFNTYDDVLDWAERLEARATRAYSDSVTMPPGGGPTSEELDLFEEWLYCAVFPQKEIRDQE